MMVMVWVEEVVGRVGPRHEARCRARRAPPRLPLLSRRTLPGHIGVRHQDLHPAPAGVGIEPGLGVVLERDGALQRFSGWG